MLEKPLRIRLVKHDIMSMNPAERNYIRFSPDHYNLVVNRLRASTMAIRKGNKSVSLEILPLFPTYKQLPNKHDLYYNPKNIIGYVHSIVFDNLAKAKINNWVTAQNDPVMMGGDPEFLAFDPESGLYLRACELKDVPNKVSQFGHDGTWLEVRPPPSQNFINFVKSIKQILKEKTNPIINYEWRTGAAFENNPNNPLPYVGEWITQGGHFHIGNPSLEVFKDKLNLIHAWVTLADILDDYIALPMVLVDYPNAYARRHHQIYGLTTNKWDWKLRTKCGRLEWRTLSAYWLISPITTFAVAGTVKAVVEAFYQIWSESKFNIEELVPPDFYQKLRQITKNDIFDVNSVCLTNFYSPLNKISQKFKINNSEVRFRIIYENDKSAVENMLLTCINKLKNLPTYKEFKTPIDILCDWVSSSEKDKRSLGIDLKPMWLSNKKTFLD